MTTSDVTVVCTVRNEETSVQELVDALAAQTLAADEIIVVDGGSDDRTVELLRCLAQSTPSLTVLSAPGTTISGGRNVAIARAKTTYIAVTDAGTEIDPHWLENLVGALRASDDVAVASGWFEPGGRNHFGRVLAAVTMPLLAEIRPSTFLPSSRSVAFRRSVWEQVGGYPEWLRHCEDLVFDLAVADAGGTFVFVPSAVVRWEARSSLRAHGRQYFNYARGDGHANLWVRRHMLRYLAYLTGATLTPLAWRGSITARAVLALGWQVTLLRYHRRLAARCPIDSWRLLPIDLVLVALVATTGDMAKMVGYPIGRWERRRAHRLR